MKTKIAKYSSIRINLKSFKRDLLFLKSILLGILLTNLAISNPNQSIKDLYIWTKGESLCQWILNRRHTVRRIQKCNLYFILRSRVRREDLWGWPKIGQTIALAKRKQGIRVSKTCWQNRLKWVNKLPISTKTSICTKRSFFWIQATRSSHCETCQCSIWTSKLLQELISNLNRAIRTTLTQSISNRWNIWPNEPKKSQIVTNNLYPISFWHPTKTTCLTPTILGTKIIWMTTRINNRVATISRQTRTTLVVGNRSIITQTQWCKFHHTLQVNLTIIAIRCTTNKCKAHKDRRFRSSNFSIIREDNKLASKDSKEVSPNNKCIFHLIIFLGKCSLKEPRK